MVLRDAKKNLKQHIVHLQRKVDMLVKEEEQQKMIAQKRAKAEEAEMEIKRRVRVEEEEERYKVREELERKRTLEKDFELFVDYKKN